MPEPCLGMGWDADVPLKVEDFIVSYSLHAAEFWVVHTKNPVVLLLPWVAGCIGSWQWKEQKWRTIFG